MRSAFVRGVTFVFWGVGGDYCHFCLSGHTGQITALGGLGRLCFVFQEW